MIYADSWPWRAGSKWAERRDRQWIEISDWSRSTLPRTGWIVRSLSHAAQGGRGNTSHSWVSGPEICQQKGQESSGEDTWDMPGGCCWRQALILEQCPCHRGVHSHPSLRVCAADGEAGSTVCVCRIGTRIAVIVLSRVWLFETTWTAARQAPLSMEFSRTEYWSGLPFPPPGVLPNPGIEPRSPALQADSLLLGKPLAHTLWDPKWIRTICLFSGSWTVWVIYDPQQPLTLLMLKQGVKVLQWDQHSIKPFIISSSLSLSFSRMALLVLC